MSRRDRSWPKGDRDVHFRGESEHQTWESRSHTLKEENFNRWEEPPWTWNRTCKNVEIICLNCMNLSFLLGGKMLKHQSFQMSQPPAGTWAEEEPGAARPVVLKIRSMEP